MNPQGFLEAARVPDSLQPQAFFPWTIERRRYDETILGELGCDAALGSPEAAALVSPSERRRAKGRPYGLVGWPTYTILRRLSEASLHLEHWGGEVVMEDSLRELRRHLPIWLHARGRVLVTGLGLGCVVRGLAANPDVTRIDVIELCPKIIAAVGTTLGDDDRIHLHTGDALQLELAGLAWEYAWHDLWTPGDQGLQSLHAKLMKRFWPRVTEGQGAWAFPRVAHRSITRSMGLRLLGAPKGRKAA